MYQSYCTGQILRSLLNTELLLMANLDHSISATQSSSAKCFIRQLVALAIDRVLAMGELECGRISVPLTTHPLLV